MQEPTQTAIAYQQDNSSYFEKIRHLPYPAWLDSCAHKSGMQEARYDIISASPVCMMMYRDGDTSKIDRQGNVHPIQSHPLQALQSELDCYTQVASTQPFCGGIIGYFGYELKSQLEPVHCPNTRHNPEADMMAGIYLWALISDHQEKSCHLVFHPDLADETKTDISNLFLDSSVAGTDNKTDTLNNKDPDFSLQVPFSCDTSETVYQQNFERIQQYIEAGDCYQINYTQRFSSHYTGDPFSAYKQLREISPAPFSAYLEFDSVSIMSHSPERFLHSSGKRITSKPIKGTRPRGRTPQEDQLHKEELSCSAKDRAENLMIVDLLRNDLGKSCTPGSIKVPSLFALESYANVHHLVSTIEGELAEDTNLIELFSNAFPGGSITGAPKIRAMEIIDQLEDQSRSIYCGSIAYISLGGQLDSSICIRTLLARLGDIHCWGGGGIVADSDCLEEREEAFSKVRNLINALENSLTNGQRAPSDRLL